MTSTSGETGPTSFTLEISFMVLVVLAVPFCLGARVWRPGRAAPGPGGRPDLLTRRTARPRSRAASGRQIEAPTIASRR